MSVITGTRWTSDCSSRTRGVGGVVLHHAAMTGSLSRLMGMMQPGGRTVSAHVGIKNGECIQAVPFSQRAWSLADQYWDSWAYTAECVNSFTNGWTLSAETHETIAQFVAAMSKEGGFYPHRNGSRRNWTVIGHREVYTIHGGSYATACPGGMDLDWIVARAQNILGSGDAPSAVAPGSVGGGYPTHEWGYDIDEVQWRINNMGYQPALVVDGLKGRRTTAGIEWAQGKLGVAVDGDWGDKTQGAYDKWSQAGEHEFDATTEQAPPFPLPHNWYFGPKSGPRESVSGYYSHREDLRRWQQQMQHRGWDFSNWGCDGLYGDETAGNCRAFQREKGLTVDGLIGPVTWEAAWTATIT